MTSSIQEKGKYYHVVICYKDEITGKPAQEWRTTGLPIAGNNKRKAEQMRIEFLQEFKAKHGRGSDILFSEYMKQWLEDTKASISENTYHGYKKTIHGAICPYFERLKIKLCDLKPYHIQEFYSYKIQNDNVSANTIHHYHANIRKALNYAVKMGRIDNNPALNVELPRKEKHIPKYYTAEELKTLLKYVKGSELETAVLLGAWFGLRRGEVVGLKWESIDFENNTLSVLGTVTEKGETSSKIDNLKYREGAKTKLSVRTFAMPQECADYLKELKATQEERQKKQRNYNRKWVDFVCVRKNGDLIPLEYITRTFPKMCEKCGLERLTFHGLRHTNISLLVQNNSNMKVVQEWAGHSSYNTTANIYSHIRAENKLELTKTLEKILK